MKMKTTFTCFSLIFFALFCHANYADSSVWKISKNGKHAYIGGTVHMLTPEDHPLPVAFDTAYKNSEILYFETDVQKASSPEFAQQMLQALMLQNGQTLETSLKPETYAKLRAFVESRGGMAAQLNLFTPSGAAIMLTAMEYTRQGFRPDLGVDITYSQKAIKDQKTVGALESVEEQLSFLANMSAGKDNELIEYTLRDLENFPAYIGELKSAWRSGNLGKMENIAINELKSQFPDAYESLVVTRNNNWMKKIIPLFETEEIEFILVGALHLSGEQGLIAQLENLGFKVQQLN